MPLREPPGSASGSGPAALRGLIDSLPEELRSRALTHSSWVERRHDSYGRLAFLGDSVLGLAVAEHLFEAHPKADIGRLTKVHGQVVSGRACAEVAGELGIGEMIRERVPERLDGGLDADALLASERAVSSICESVIGACYLHHGAEPTAAAILAAFAGQIELASEQMLDFKSALQERVARTGERVRYRVVSEQGPAHAKTFGVEATIAGEPVASGSGRSKKAAEQAAAARALADLEAAPPLTGAGPDGTAAVPQNGGAVTSDT